MPGHIQTLIYQCIELFDFTDDQSPNRKSLCIDVIDILNEYRSVCQNWDSLLKSSLLIAEKVKALSLSEDSAIVIEPLTGYLLKLAVDGYFHTEIDWAAFKEVIAKWAKSSVVVARIWKDVMHSLSVKLKKSTFSNEKEVKLWEHLLDVVGDPKLFTCSVRLAWVTEFSEIISFILDPPYLSANGNLLLKLLLPRLSKLIHEQSSGEIQEKALGSLFEIFVKTKSKRKPKRAFIEHLCYYVSLARENSVLRRVVLTQTPYLLVYPAVHSMIPVLLEISGSLPQHSLNLLFAIMSYPNCYGALSIYSPMGEIAYSDLKGYFIGIIYLSLEQKLNIVPNLYLLTIHCIEESIYGTSNLQGIIDSLFSYSKNTDENTSRVSFHCLTILSSLVPTASEKILDLLISELTVNQKKPRIRSILHCACRCMMNSTEAHQSIEKLILTITILRKDIMEPSILNDIEDLTTILSLYYNNPDVNEILYSYIPDNEFSGTTRYSHFSLGKTTILSIPKTTSTAKIITRTPYGKFAIDSTSFSVFSHSTFKEAASEPRDLATSLQLELDSSTQPEQLAPEALLTDLVEYMESHYPDLPRKNLPQGDEPLSLLMKNIESQEQSVTLSNSSIVKECDQLSPARLFVSHIGIIEQLSPLDPGENTERALGLLDSEQPREFGKIGVLYVKPFQQTESEILANSSGSLKFQNFLRNLGDPIEIATHKGNLGGLDRQGSNGEFTLSYINWEYDIVFHIAPLMPTERDSEQQILKKRHVGNDLVNIVWSEEYRDYRIDTILTHLNSVVIVIYPMNCELFRISVLKKIDVEVGPLQDGMVIPWGVLAPLVRETVIHANESAKAVNFKKYQRKYAVRKGQISEIIDRFSLKLSQPELYSLLI